MMLSYYVSHRVPKDTICFLFEAELSPKLHRISCTEDLVHETPSGVDDYGTFSDLSTIQPLSISLSCSV